MTEAALLGARALSSLALVALALDDRAREDLADAERLLGEAIRVLTDQPAKREA